MSLGHSNIRTLGVFGVLVASGIAVRFGLRSRRDKMLRPRIVGDVPQVSASEVARYLKVTGAEPYMYRDSSGRTLVPPTYFATWGLEQLARALLAARLPLNFARVMHAASNVKIDRLPHTGERCRFSATVETVVQTGRRVRVEQRLDLVDADGAPLSSSLLAMVVPATRGSGQAPKREPELAPFEAEELARIILRSDEGLRYAMVSGDFNPSHWIAPFARLTGLAGPIAHGFDLMARMTHTVVGLKAQGDPRRLRYVDVTFRRPVVLPAMLRLFVKPEVSELKDQSRLHMWLAQEAGAAASVSGYAEIGL